MSSGTFRTQTSTIAGTGNSRYIYVNWESENNIEDNTSKITWEAFAGSDDANKTKSVQGWVSIKINNQTVYDSGNKISLYKDTKIASGEIIVPHEANGTKTIDVSISSKIYSSGYYYYGFRWQKEDSKDYSGYITMNANPVYGLHIHADENADIVISRVYCAGGSEPGVVYGGANTLCYGDRLVITAVGQDGYIVDDILVNDDSFASGNTYTVVGGVSVVVSSGMVTSHVSATDATIGNKSIITITKPDVPGNTYSHSLKYEFGELTGYINDTGNTQEQDYILSSDRVEFTIPDLFYSQLPSSRSGVCRIICTTYVKTPDSIIGTIINDPKQCEFTVSINSKDSDCFPDVTVRVSDASYAATILTGSNFAEQANKNFIRHRSEYSIEIDAFPQKYASIDRILINNIQYDPTTRYEDGRVSLQATLTVDDQSSFDVTVFDSRNLAHFARIRTNIINYIILTCNPVFERPTPTSNEIILSCTGNFFNGSFGRLDNRMYMKYRYKVSGSEIWSNWIDIDTSQMILTDGKYRTPQDGISLGSEFSYKNNYEIELSVHDGNEGIDMFGSSELYVLSEITKEVIVYKGIPIFDWGDKDFAFNVPININIDPEEDRVQEKDSYIPININGQNILDLLYPKGAVYLSTAASPPEFLQSHWGEWGQIALANDLMAFYGL